MKNFAHFLFGIFGNASALFLFLSPVITFWRVVKKKSTEEFSGIPYNMALLNCLLYTWYGLPLVSPNNLLVSTINGTGAGLEIIYVLLFIIYAPKKERMKILGIFTFVLRVFAAVVLVSLLALHGNSRKLLCGIIAAVFSTAILVIKTKSVEFMPFFLSLFCFLTGASWFIYGLLGNDLFVTVPNSIGCFLGAVQLILYMIYRDKKKEASSEKPVIAVEDSMEMGSLKPLKKKQTNNSNANPKGTQ